MSNAALHGKVVFGGDRMRFVFGLVFAVVCTGVFVAALRKNRTTASDAASRQAPLRLAIRTP
jgi:hypothetical protein